MALSAACARSVVIGSASVRAGGDPACRSRLIAAGVRGKFAFFANRKIYLFDLPDCNRRLLVAQLHDLQQPLRFSGDGRYLAYGNGAVILTAGHSPRPQHPLGKVAVWAWSPRDTELAAVTERGAVDLWTPGRRPRQILPDGWEAGALDATGVAFSPDGRHLAVVRTTSSASHARARQLWVIDLRTGHRRLLVHTTGITLLILAGFTPDGRNVLYWPDLSGSASIQADGLPLAAVSVAGGHARTVVRVMLTYPEFIARCGMRLVVTAGPIRQTNYDKWLDILALPKYHAASLGLSRTEAWVDPTCSDHGAIAVAAGPSNGSTPFGLEHRSLWLISAPGRRPIQLTRPESLYTSDELPRIGANGRYILFIRGRANRHSVQSATLQVLSLGVKERTLAIGPIGSGGIGYYDTYPWSYFTDWYPAQTSAGTP